MASLLLLDITFCLLSRSEPQQMVVKKDFVIRAKNGKSTKPRSKLALTSLLLSGISTIIDAVNLSRVSVPHQCITSADSLCEAAKQPAEDEEEEEEETQH